MNKSIISNLGFYRQLFKDNRDFLRIVRVTNDAEVATDGSGTRILCETVTDSLQCFITLSFDPALQSPAMKDDLWLCGFINGDLNNGIAIQRIYNMKDPAHPKTVMNNETVLSSRKGKKINVSNDHSATLTENAVLGPALVTWLLKLTSEIKGLADDINSIKSKVTEVGGAGSWATAGTAVLMPDWLTVTASPEKSAIESLEAESETDKFLSDLLYIQEKDLDNSPKED